MVVAATWEVEVGGSPPTWFKTSPDKVSMRCYYKNKLKKYKKNQMDWGHGSSDRAFVSPCVPKTFTSLCTGFFPPPKKG
jgi:hypothetical protein